VFPLFHALHAVKKLGEEPGVFVGSVLPDVLRYAGWSWDRSHSVDRLLSGIDGLTGVAEASKDHIGVDSVSDASFAGVPIGWAFYRAMEFMGGKVFRSHMTVWVWALHNVVEGLVEIPIWRCGVDSVFLRNIFENYGDWDILASVLNISSQTLRGLYIGYVAFSVDRYSSMKQLLVDIVIRKFNRYSLSVSPTLITTVVADMLGYYDSSDLFKEIWMLTGGEMDVGVPC